MPLRRRSEELQAAAIAAEVSSEGNSGSGRRMRAAARRVRAELNQSVRTGRCYARGVIHAGLLARTMGHRPDWL